MAAFHRLQASLVRAQSVCRTLRFSRVNASLSRSPSSVCCALTGSTPSEDIGVRVLYGPLHLFNTSRTRALCITSQYLQKRSYYSDRFRDELNSAQSVDQVLDVFVTHRDALDPVSVSSCLYTLLRVAKTQRVASVLTEHPGVKQFLEYVINRVPHFPVHVAAVCLHNCSKYDFQNDELLSCLIDVCKQQPLSLNSMGEVLSALVWLGRHSETQQLFVDIAKQLASWLEVKEFQIHPGTLSRVVHLLVMSGNWVDELNGPLLAYLETHILEWDNLHHVSLTLLALVKQKVIHRSPVLLARAQKVAFELLPDDTNPHNTAMLFKAFGLLPFGCHRDYFEALSKKITTLSPGFLEPGLLSTVAWACSRMRYYCPSLLDCIAEHSMAKLSQFNSEDLGNLAYAFGRLNHQTPLLTAIAQRLESDPKLIADTQALYRVAWACMVLDIYPHKLFQYALFHECIQGTLENSSAFTSYHHLMQLHVAVTVEHPELQLAGLSKPQMKEVASSALKRVQRSHEISAFESNVIRALKQLTGDYSCITGQPMTTHGYFLDAELLLNKDNKPIKIPRAWKSRRFQTMENIILQHGSSVFMESEQVSFEGEQNIIDLESLLGSLKTAEVNHQHTNDCGINSDTTNYAEPADNLAALLHSYPRTIDAHIFVNLASDWQDIVPSPMSEPVARRIAIEADGPWHYGRHCRHVLGYTVLKRRQLQALGWEVIPIPYFEWKRLKSDQDRVQFLAEKLFGH